MIDKELQTLIAAKDYENAIAFLMKEIEINIEKNEVLKSHCIIG